MVDATIDPTVARVLETYEARAQREEQLWNTLSDEQVRKRLDEFLLPVGRAAGTLINLIVKEGKARRILEVGASYGYSTIWLAEAARAVGGRVISCRPSSRTSLNFASAMRSRRSHSFQGPSTSR